MNSSVLTATKCSPLGLSHPCESSVRDVSRLIKGEREHQALRTDLVITESGSYNITFIRQSLTLECKLSKHLEHFDSKSH